ncbi:MAG: purine-nucleoside phosphorylase [Chloroflexi bacterium]|nr:purine-nucleoside phosphorylase [Chloroflexota bacterium]
MTEFFTRVHYQESAAYIRSRTKHQPKIALVLGSGFGELADAVQNADIISSKDIPHWPPSTVEGHSGQLVIGVLEGKTVLVQQGRAHYYEGHSIHQVTLPVRAMRELGITHVFFTNAAGGINQSFKNADLMAITDHINFLGFGGVSPLRGPNDPTLGPRFLDMLNAYDKDLRALAVNVAKEAGIDLKQGVYGALAGPTFESNAELRFLKIAGCDAVGMSTASEVIVARHGGMKVLAISGISNMVNLDGSTPTDHEEVLATGKILAPKLMTVLRGVLKNLEI